MNIKHKISADIVREVEEKEKAELDTFKFKNELAELINQYANKINMIVIWQELKTQCKWAEFNFEKILETRYNEQFK